MFAIFSLNCGNGGNCSPATWVSDASRYTRVDAWVPRFATRSVEDTFWLEVMENFELHRLC